MLVVLDGLAGVDDSSVAGLELGIVVEGFAYGLAFFDGGVNAFEGFGEAGFERGLAPGRFGDKAASCLSPAASSWARTWPSSEGTGVWVIPSSLRRASSGFVERT